MPQRWRSDRRCEADSSSSTSAVAFTAEDLQSKVLDAVEYLGTGFLNAELATELRDHAEARAQFFDEVLDVTYRLLFLLFAEGRGLFPAGAPPEADLYRTEFSVTAFRHATEEEHDRERSSSSTLWDRLQHTFRSVEEGKEGMGIFPYPGSLFDSTRLRLIDSCDDDSLLRAMRALTVVEREGPSQRTPFDRLEVEILGATYESLLDFEPQVVEVADTGGHAFVLDTQGLDRKKTGSYYTHRVLVDELLRTTLLPVMRERLATVALPLREKFEVHVAGDPLLECYDGLDDAAARRAVEALLTLKVCDPSSGSGHFLVAANRVLGAEVARLRQMTEDPSHGVVQQARRDVLENCIYAVDLNPMAVELCKASLWLSAGVPSQPFPFLEDQVKCGDSLVGAVPDLLEVGVPYAAFGLGRPGDDRDLVKNLRKRNREERRESKRGEGVQLQAFRVQNGQKGAEGEQNQHARNGAPGHGAPRHLAATEKNGWEADLWTAALFWPMPEGTDWAPTYGELLRFRREGESAIPSRHRAAVQKIVGEHRFFHWHLEFPEVCADGGGFDVILGNPPFSAKLDKRNRQALKLLYPGLGTTNTAALFIALCLRIISPAGRIGLVCPKSVTYSKRWEEIRERIAGKLRWAIDCGRAWENVLLEQVLLVIGGSKTSCDVKTGVLTAAAKDTSRTEVPQVLLRRQDVILTDGEAVLFKLLERQVEWPRLGELVRSQRGAGVQRKLKESGSLPVYGGRDLARFRLQGVSGYIAEEELECVRQDFSGPKAMFQNVIAHVENPSPHIKLIGTVDRGDAVCLDTVNMIRPTSGALSVEAITGILCSSMMNWLIYRMAYNKAIRTMHFDQYFLDKVPLPPGLVESEASIAGHVLRLEQVLSESGAQPTGRRSVRSIKAIDGIVFEAFGVSKTEAQHIRQEFPADRL